MALDIRRARRHFAAVDPVMHGLVRLVGPCRLDTRVAPDPFEALVRAIAAQQVSAKAARTVFARLQSAARGRVTAARLNAIDASALAATGLGPTKARYVQDLAAHASDGRIQLNELATLDDASVVEALTSVRGIGRWTAEVFLIFQLSRLDVFPAADLALLSAMQRLYRMRRRPSPSHARDVAERWRPYRSIASWYLWRSLDVPDDAVRTIQAPTSRARSR